MSVCRYFGYDCRADTVLGVLCTLLSASVILKLKLQDACNSGELRTCSHTWQTILEVPRVQSSISGPKSRNTPKRCQSLVTRPKYPPPPIARQVWQYPCRTVISVVLQTIAATPPLLSIKMDNRSPKTDLGSRKKLASEAHRAVGALHEIVSPITL